MAIVTFEPEISSDSLHVKICRKFWIGVKILGDFIFSLIQKVNVKCYGWEKSGNV